eukprot:m.275715 g.275715  ORF g.275715 m.275715 type:complete len:51 (+) comp104849_c0_seq1:124-276(+)
MHKVHYNKKNKSHQSNFTLHFANLHSQVFFLQKFHGRFSLLHDSSLNPPW